MVNERLLKSHFALNGMTQEEVAKSIGMHPRTLGRKIKGGVFGSDEIARLIELLHIEDPMSVFFAQSVN